MFARLSHASRRRLPIAASSSFTTQSLLRPFGFTLKMSATGDRTIKTAACLIIGDEVLGGKTVDTNSAYLAKWCFSLGINLKRIEVIEDDESEIMEAVSRMSNRYDFIVTSGGIGPTHDDITYPSIAKAFGLPLKLHQETFDKMKKLSKPNPKQPNFDWNVDSPALRARLRMVELPTDESRDVGEQVIFPQEDLWVPVAVVNRNVHILPGVPLLFQKLLDGLKPHVLPRLVDPEGKGIHRIMISTPLPESSVAEYLTTLAARVEPHGVKVGSYPRWGRKRNTVTLVGRDKAYLESLVAEAEEAVQGKRVSKEDELDEPADKTEKKL
ncbi:MoaB/Mog domain-containing protein [Trichoderma austrokoningii]